VPFSSAPAGVPALPATLQAPRAAPAPALQPARASLLPPILGAVSAQLTTPRQSRAAHTFTWTLRGPTSQAIPLSLVDLAGCWSQAEVRQVLAHAATGQNLPVRLDHGRLVLAHVRAVAWPLRLRVTFGTAFTTTPHAIRMTVRTGAALLLPRAQRAAAVTVSLLPGPACGSATGRLPLLPHLSLARQAAGVSSATSAPAALPRPYRVTTRSSTHVAAAPPLVFPARPDHHIASNQPTLPVRGDVSIARLLTTGAQPLTDTLQLQAGWNLITLPLSPTTALDAHTVLASLIATTHGKYAELDAYTNGQFSPSLYDDPGDHLGIGGVNFTLQLGQGYALYTDVAGSFPVTGTSAANPPQALAAGWNLVGFPAAAASQTQAYTLLTTLLAQTGGGYAEMDGYSNGQFSPSAYDDPSDRLGLGGTNFILQTGQGYALYTDRPGQLGPAAGTPSAPTAITGAPADGQVTVFWAIPDSEGGSPITDYKIYVSDGSVVDVGSAATGAVVGGLTDGTAYTFTVAAINAVGQGPRSAPSTPVTPVALPPEPSTVAPPTDATVATNVHSSTQFLYTGNNPIQTGVVSGTIEITRTAVLRGRVLDLNGDPLAGAAITVLDHPEFGQTTSRADGRFDMAVNGGGQLTVAYSMPGYLPVQRQVQAPWQDYGYLPDVNLTPYDPHVTTVNTGASATTLQVVQGSMSHDVDGTRQATLLFPPGTTAVMTMTNGLTETLTGPLQVRATELTVGSTGPDAMPGPLPPTSGYTYAADFSVDAAIAAGAASVGFSQPIPVYVQNFLGFPIGSPVPIGYYDRQQGRWVGAPNGRVIGILGSTVVNGTLEAQVDVDGAGQAATAAELAALGISDAELARLATLYSPGQTLWRVAITHFTPWDCNWPYGPPPDASAPPSVPDDPPPAEPNQDCGCIIGVQQQSLGQLVPIAGTPFKLRYQSDRQSGYLAHNRLVIPVTGSSVPPDLARVVLEIDVAGQAITQTFPATPPDQSYVFDWNGRDVYGQVVRGTVTATVKTSYLYSPVYQTPAQTAQSFAQFGSAISAYGGRSEIAITTVSQVPLGFVATASGLGGWDLDIHNAYDPVGHTLYLGDGTSRAQSPLLGAGIITVAGNGSPGYSGDGGPATAASLFGWSGFLGVAVGPDGSLYIADTGNNRIRKVAPDGSITTVAGNGGRSYGGDGGPATAASLNIPYGVAVGPDGSLYIADTGNNRIRKVAPDGSITTVAGKGDYSYGGDGGPATAASLSFPGGVAVGPDGSLYIADTYNDRIRKVAPDGSITTVAGKGDDSYGGDGGPATAASLSLPYGVAVDPDGSLYIADTGNSRIRKVAPDGSITTVAGKGGDSYGGDGGPATAASLSFPEGVAVGPDGSLYIADTYNDRIRKVAPDGSITTVAGKGDYSYGGDGGPATAASLSLPYGVAVGPDGSLYIADTYNNRIREVASPLPGVSAGGGLLPSADGREVYSFDSTGRHLQTFDALTGATRYSFGYDSAGRLISVTDGSGNTTSIQHDAGGNPTAIIAPNGAQTILATDGNGYLSSITDPAGRVTRLVADATGMLQSFTDANGNTGTYQYDSLGRLTLDQEPGPNGGSTTLSRVDGAAAFTVTTTSALGRSTAYVTTDRPDGSQRQTIIDPAGGQTVTSINPNGTQTTTYPDGSVFTQTNGPDPRWGMLAPLTTQFQEQFPSGLRQTVTATRTAALADPANPLSLQSETTTISTNGTSTTQKYNASTRTLTLTSPAGRQSTMVLDTLGRPVQQTYPGVLPAQFSYDSKGRLSTIVQGTRAYTLAYDQYWNLASITDPLGEVTTVASDPVGEPTTITRPDASTIQAAYDGNGNVTSITPPGETTRTFAYTSRNLLQTYTPPALTTGGTPTGYQHNADQQISSINQPDGTAITLSYDNAGRVTGVAIPRGTASYSYDPATENLTSITVPNGGIVSYSYDGALLTGVSTSGPVPGTIGYSYDTQLRLSSETVDGSTVTFGYDGDSDLTQAGAEQLSYDPASGQYTGSTLGSTTDSRSYDPFGDLSTYQAMSGGTTLLADQFTRDALDRITSMTEVIDGATHTYAYGYDTLGQLTNVQQDGVTIATYRYDRNGNRLSTTTPSGTVTGSYDPQDRLTQYGTVAYTYTANGSLASKIDSSTSKTTIYSYDDLGNLTRVVQPDGAQITYLIDGQNRRIGKEVNGTLVQGFVYDDYSLTPVAETDGSGNIVSQFVYTTNAGAPASMIKDGITYRIIADHLGSPRLVVNTSTGQIVQEMDYDAWGNVITDTNPGFQPFGFAGGLYDHDTGLVRFGARDYDPLTGRWLAPDPLLYGGAQANLYEYPGDNPISLIDPSGLYTWGQWLGLTPGTIALVVAEVVCILAEPCGAAELVGVGAGILLYEVGVQCSFYVDCSPPSATPPAPSRCPSVPDIPLVNIDVLPPDIPAFNVDNLPHIPVVNVYDLPPSAPHIPVVNVDDLPISLD
jgi:RHS repeat-associated protein